jgi:hypothetical protein
MEPSRVNRAVEAALATRGPVEIGWSPDFSLTACPVEGGVILTVVAKNVGRTTVNNVLQKRTSLLPKYGFWLPAMQSNDRLMVVRKLLLNEDFQVEPFHDDWLDPALELLS